MAKYRITSIPSSLPKAQVGKTFKNWVPKEEGQQVDQPVTGIQQPSYWNDMLSPVVRGEQCPPGKFPYNGTCVTETEYLTLAKERDALEDAQTAREKKARDERNEQESLKAREDLENQLNRSFQGDVDRYYNTFKNSKKSDKIEPFERISLSDLDPEREKELQSEYLINKNPETGYAELYPKSIAFDRIINNGFRANQFKNYWGLDPKQVKEQLGDLITAADAQYDATVTQKILKKALDEGKSPEEIIAGLPSTLGTKSGLKTKFEKPTKKIINDAFKQTGDALLDNIQSVDRDQIYKDSDVFLESGDPQAAWENKYYNAKTDLGAYLNYHGKKIEEGDKAYKYWMDKGQNPNQDLRFAKDDAMANQRDANAERNRMVTNVIANKAWKKEHAKSKEFDEATGKYVSNLAGNEIKDVYRKALNDASLSTKDKLTFLKEFETDPNSAVESLLNTKSGKGKKTYANMLSENIDNAYMSELTRPQLKQGTSNNENTTASKIMDVLHHPFDAAYFAMDPRREMWGDYNQSYDTRMDIGKRTGADTGMMPNDNPLAIIRDYTQLQALNPFKIGFNLNKGMHEGRFLGAVADELIDIGTKKGIVKGFNALGNLGKAGNIAAGTNLLGAGTKGVGLAKNLKKGAGALLSGLNNPALNVGYLLETPENISNAYSDLKQGNYGSAALNTAYAGFGAAPVLAGLKTLKSLRKPGTVLTSPNLNTQYTGMYNAATPGSGIGIGNPSLNTAQPVFQSLTNPVNKLTKGLGFGEFSVLKQNPNIPVTPMPYNKAINKNGGLVKAQTGAIIKGLKDLGRRANIATVGTTNTLAKTLAPVMIHPMKALTFGAGYKGLGPFTGSPLNALPFYGKKLTEERNNAYRKFGDTLDYVKLSKSLNPSAGPLLRMGKSQVANEGNWAALNEVDEAYPGVFAAQFDFNNPKTNLGYINPSNRNGVLITDKNENNLPSVPTSDPGLSLHRRLPFSNRYVSVNMDKLNNDQFDWKTQGGNLQSLLERYGYGAAGAAALAGIGVTAPQEYLDEYINNPVREGFNKTREFLQPLDNKAEELLVNPWVKEEGGELQKAQTGKFLQTGKDIARLLKPTSNFRKTLSSLENLDDLPGVRPVLNKIAKPPVLDFIEEIEEPLKVIPHNVTLDKLKDDISNYSNPGGTSLIQYGDETHKGMPWYNIDPADYPNMDSQKEGMKDASDAINRGLNYNKPYNRDTFNNVGDFDFKDFSDGWLARQAMMNMTSKPQKKLSKNDFYTLDEFSDLVNKQTNYLNNRASFDEMYPENPGMEIMRALSGDTSRDELFSNLFPNSGIQNFKQKFYSPELIDLIKNTDRDEKGRNLYDMLSVTTNLDNNQMLNRNRLETINATGDTLPRTYQDLLKAQKKDNFLTRSPAKDVVMEMRGGLGLKMEDIKNATPEQLEKWRQEIVKKMNKQTLDRWNKDLAIPYKGKDAYKQISDVPGYKNKKGGVVTSLTRKEIDQYIKDGYIIEDE